MCTHILPRITHLSFLKYLCNKTICNWSDSNEKYNSDKQWELVNFCEFDKYATKSYCAIHNVDESKNLGDITKVDETWVR